MIIRTIAVVSLALLLVSCAVGRVSDSVSSTPVIRGETVTPEILDNGWYRFTNVEVGYSIDYPQNSYLTISHDVALEYPQVVISLGLASGYQDMQIIVYSNQESVPIKEFVLQEIYQGELSQDKIEELILQPIRVAKFDALKLDMEPFLPGILISANSKVYFISLPVEMKMGNRPSAESIELFYEVVNTFMLK